MAEPAQVAQFRAEILRDPELAEKLAGEPVEAVEHAVEVPTHPSFPEAAWRGLFLSYRDALRGKSEAPEPFHFGAVWAACAATLERRVSFPYGLTLYPNIYILCWGPTGDKKTSAERLAAREAECAGVRVIRGGGSGEGIADELQQGAALVFSEEFSSILRPARWEGATLGPLLTQAFDCPPRYELKYRKSRIEIDNPTLSLLAATTPEWFWRDARDVDLAGGLGNRLLYLDGRAQEDVPLPGHVDVVFLAEALRGLREIGPTEVQLEPQAEKLWITFYRAWRRQSQGPLEAAMTKRLPAYALKLAMLYASLEKTLPCIEAGQLGAAILVVRYAAGAVGRLIDLRHAGTNQVGDLEQKILHAVRNVKCPPTTKRYLQRSLSKYIASAQDFNRAFDALVKSEQISIEVDQRRRTWVWPPEA